MEDGTDYVDMEEPEYDVTEAWGTNGIWQGFWVREGKCLVCATATPRRHHNSSLMRVGR